MHKVILCPVKKFFSCSFLLQINMKKQDEMLEQNLLLIFSILLGVATTTAVGMPTTTRPGNTAKCTQLCKVNSHPNENKWSADCSSSNFSDVPKACNFVEELKTDHNSIHNINKAAFENYQHLLFLSMRNNGIYTIEADSFVNTKLEDIDLSENDLQTLPASAFNNLTNLTQLKLRSNRLNAIGSYNLPKLILLNLSNNEINQLNRSSFRRMPRIKYLDLSGNRITHLGNNCLGKLRDLVTLKLSHNRIAYINIVAFVYLVKLEELHLDYNSLSDLTIPDKMFQYQLQLRLLNLSGNNLQHLRASLLYDVHESLEYLEARSNDMTLIEESAFINFSKLRGVDLTSNKLSDDSGSAIQILYKNSQEKVQIFLAGNPICEEYVIDFQNLYNTTVFCDENETKEYVDHDHMSRLSRTTQRIKTSDKTEHETLTTICVIAAAVLLALIVLLLFISKKYRYRRRNYARTMNNMGYNYPHDADTVSRCPNRNLRPVPPPPVLERDPPPVPERGPNIAPTEEVKGPYMNGTFGSNSTASYIQPRSTPCSTIQSTCRHHHQHPPPQRDHRVPNKTLPPRPAMSIPDLRQSADTSAKVNRSQSITVIGTNIAGGSCRQMRVSGLPKVHQWRRRVSRHFPGMYTQRRETRDGRPIDEGRQEEESTYMIRQETEDGKPINSTLKTNNSEPTDNS